MSKKETGHTNTSPMDQVLCMLELCRLPFMKAINSAIRVTPEQFDAIKAEGHGEVIWRSDTKYSIGQHHIVSDSAVNDEGRRAMIVTITDVKNHNNCPEVIPCGFKKISFDYFDPKPEKPE